MESLNDHDRNDEEEGRGGRGLFGLAGLGICRNPEFSELGFRDGGIVNIIGFIRVLIMQVAPYTLNPKPYSLLL